MFKIFILKYVKYKYFYFDIFKRKIAITFKAFSIIIIIITFIINNNNNDNNNIIVIIIIIIIITTTVIQFYIYSL